MLIILISSTLNLLQLCSSILYWNTLTCKHKSNHITHGKQYETNFHLAFANRPSVQKKQAAKGIGKLQNYIKGNFPNSETKKCS